MLLEKAIYNVYGKFKLQFYKAVFSKVGEREATLSTVETFCMEIIHGLNRPTINEFASFIEISPPNATYKVNSLVQKGYLKKVQSLDDKREYYLEPTEKYFAYYNLSYGYLSKVIERIRKRFSPEDVEKFQSMLEIISNELMQELPFEINMNNKVESDEKINREK